MNAIIEWLALATSSIVFACIAYIIDVSSEYLSDLRIGYCEIWYLNKKSCAEDFTNGNIFHYLFYSTLFGTIGTMLTLLAPRASGSGIPEVKVILSNVHIPQVLDFRTLIIKAFGLVYGVGSGLMLGKEGPLVHISVALQSMFLLDNNLPLLSAATSAGVSCAFGTPIGGVLFSFEEVSHNFNPNIMWKCCLASLVSLVTLQFLNPFNNGKSVMFKVNYVNSFYIFELLNFILLGIAGGLFGHFFIKFNMKRQQFKKKSFDEVILLSFVTAILSYPFDFTFISNSELIVQLFQPCHPDLPLCDPNFVLYNLFQLSIAILLKFVLMVVTFGSLIPAGIFIPSMVLGAICGRILGILTNLYFPVNSGLYALIGAASFLSGTTRMTLSLVVIMFELTNTPYFALPIMMTILISKYVGGIFGPGIYDTLIAFRKYPYLPQLENLQNQQIKLKVATQPIKRIMEPIECLQTGITIQALMLLEPKMYFICGNWILTPQSLTLICKFYGYAKNARICFIEENNMGDHGIELVGDELNLFPFITRLFIFLPETPISICCQVFEKMELNMACVCEDEKLLGFISKEILVDYMRS